MRKGGRIRFARRGAVALALLSACPLHAQSEAPAAKPAAPRTEATRPPADDESRLFTDHLPAVQVIGVTPLPGLGVPRSQVPAAVQSGNAQDIERSGARGIADYLQRGFNGVFVNELQGNPFQPDVNYRGYTASPLLGTPQGLSLYLDGVRLNQPFGDVVSWDLIPRAAIATVSLLPGSNPMYGLNTLGGAIAMQTKDGLRHAGSSAQAKLGSWGRRSAEFEHGASNAAGLDWYVTGSAFGEDGWRTASPSKVSQWFGKLGWSGGSTRAWASFAYTDSQLNGNGLQEQRMLGLDRASVYTRPDTTENRSGFLTLSLTHSLTEDTRLSGNAWYRRIDTRTLNADINEGALDQSVYQPNAAERAALTAAGYSGFPAAGESAANTPFPFWRCIANVLRRDEPAEKCSGLINRTQSNQSNYGSSGQVAHAGWVAGLRHQLTAGASLDVARTKFAQGTQLGYLNPDRTVTPVNAFGDGVTGGNVDGAPYDTRVDLDSASRTWSVFATDTMALAEALHLTASGRYNHTSVRNRDGINPGGGARSLDGDHRFMRFNPAIGLNFTPDLATSIWAGWNQGSRAPTAIELGCANPAQPCRLPNAMAGDPPLKQVIARTLEIGARGGSTAGQGGALQWNASAFRAENVDDILFVASPNNTQFGYFRNVGKTRREGLELGLRAAAGPLSGGVQYSLVHATYQTEEVVNGNGNSTNAAGRGLEGNIRIRPGDRIPLVPLHQLKLNADWQAAPGVSLGANLVAVGSSFARGNENNLHSPDGSRYLGPGKSPGYAVLNLSAQFQVEPALGITVQLDNLFDRRYSTGAQLGPTGFDGRGNFIARPFPAIGAAFPVQQATFYAPGAPRAIWIGLRYSFDAPKGG